MQDSHNLLNAMGLLEVSTCDFVTVFYISDSLCLGCYIANGHILMFSLPSLKPMLDVDHMPVTDVR